ncbi:basic amino acid ABC transporter substrate-binding protein [Robertmurraya yapensis]|uniref:Basic amino acid ABC transporter substrate-binding protein n=2 Tax=Bacillaceae TaxID=186817 RepID=A0A3S0KF78_9BACI|nr:basic amino acid ABC transporter substrate-binding protein [Bacillus yapensis]RTR29206.1 basic amino acid ABC transporter substrate-binding protein [Bacillus yapensis]TKS94811.1 transporter substrate-binding domain-containing protein [Bacillus yapensis]
MKKLSKLGLVLVLGLMMLLTACGSSETGSTDSGNSGDSGSDEKKKLRIVTDAAYAPFESLEGDKVVGFDVDFVSAVLEEAGYEVVAPEHVGWDPLFIEIESEEADLAISAITINSDREQTYDFSVPYFLSTNKILIPKDSDIKSGADLKGKTVAVQNGTTGQETAESILGANSPDVKKFENNNLAIQELLAGGADAVIADNTVIEEYAKNNPDQNLVVIADDSFAQEFYGVMFPQGSDLKVEFDEAINKVFDSGKYAEIYKEWFGVEPDVENLKAQQ